MTVTRTLLIIYTISVALTHIGLSQDAEFCLQYASHIFLPVAVETAGAWNQSAIDPIQEIGRRITAVTEDTRETVFLFQCLSIALQRGNEVAFLATFDAM